MTNAELLKKVKQAKGAIYGAVLGGHDVYHIRLVRNHLIQYIQQMDQTQEADMDLTKTDGNWYLDSPC